MGGGSQSDGKAVAPPGQLSKWANYLKGWKRRWFELESPGVLVYYKGKPTNRKRGRKRYRGTIVLNLARVRAHPTNKRRFSIETPKGTFYFRAKTNELRAVWISAILEAKAFYEQQVPTFPERGLGGSSGGNPGTPRSQSPSSPHIGSRRGTVTLGGSQGGPGPGNMQELIGLGDSVAHAEQRAEQLLQAMRSVQGVSQSDLARLQQNADSLVQAVHRCLEGMGAELERRLRLEETVRDLTRANYELRERIEGGEAPPEEVDVPSDEGDTQDDGEQFDRHGSLSDDDDDESGSDSGDFVDAMETLQVSINSHRGSLGPCNPPALSEAPTLGEDDYKGPSLAIVAAKRENNTGEWFQAMPSHGAIDWRTRLPADKPGKKESGGGLWTLLKNAIGKDLSRITLPAYYNEPLTVLQRSAEELEHIHLVREAAAATNPHERMMWICAFAMSAYHTTVNRPGKPFNPMLGETFEWDRTRDGLGVRFFAEQVSHHPPVTALHCVGPDFIFHADSQIKSKFWGNSLEVFPTGTLHLHLPKWGEHYTWSKVTTCIHALFGSRWVDHYGDMSITNHATGDVGHLKFIKKGWLSGQYEISGSVSDSRGKTFCLLWGHWNEALYALPPHIDESERKKRGKAQAKSAKAEGRGKSEDSGRFDPSLDPECTLLWRAPERPEHSAAQYNLCTHAMQLNDLPDELRPWLAPTDSRFRPDQRCLENGEAQKATEEKLRLEEKQRAARRRREAAGEAWKVQWFEKRFDPDSQTEGWVYKGDYFERRARKDWEGLPDIW